MSHHNAKTFTEEQIKNALDTAKTVVGAAAILKIDRRTFKKEAVKYGLYKSFPRSGKKFNLIDILEGKHPTYPTSKITPRLIKEGYKTYNCEECGISEWQGKKISLELDHIDGINTNHSLNNLRLLCPNCHSQTDTYRSKKLKLNKK